MNDFLNQIWEDNPVRNYFIVVGVILFTILLKRIIARYCASLLFKIVKKIWKDVDRESFINLLFQPIGLFLLIFVTIVSLHKLNFPPNLNVELYGYTAKQIIHSIGRLILIISFIWLLLRIIDFIALILKSKADLAHDKAENQLVVFFRDFFKVVISIIGVMMVLNFVFGYHIGSLITGLSIVGAAIALALRESLENLIASFVIFLDKPFTTGDLVKIKDVSGTVEKIGLRSTRIRSEYQTYISVPNKQMVDNILDNHSLRMQRRADISLQLSLQTPMQKIKEISDGLRKILTDEQVINSYVHVSDISGTAIVITANYYTAPIEIHNFIAFKEKINLACLKLLEEMNVEVAGSSTEIRVIKDAH